MGSDLLERSPDLEKLALTLQGVRGAKVEMGPQGVTAVRVLVVPERETESTIEDIRRLALAELGLELEPGTIQVLRTNESPHKEERLRRRRLSSLTTERGEGGFRARVTLELPGDVLVGESAAPGGALFERRSVARAVLEGLRALLDFPVEIDTIEIIRHGNRGVAVVTVHRGDDSLVGTAFVRKGEHDAVARATLDALNRFLGATVTQSV